MESMYVKYDNLLKNTEWEYYHLPADIRIFEDDRCKTFIREYLKKGDKTGMAIFEYLDSITLERTKHILSCFLLGFLMYKENSLIQQKIDRFLISIPAHKRMESSEKCFRYIWMLVCLFHDFGYAIEEKKESITNDEVYLLINKLPGKFKGVPKLYGKELLIRYDKYICCRFNKHDHGVIGGAKLYNDLCLLRQEKERTSDMLYWGDDLENDFAVAAWAIACHNIFYIEELSKYIRCYERFGLEQLVYSGVTRKINIERHPIFYLLCLVDSIEPIKTCHDVSILNEIRIVILPSIIEIHLEDVGCLCNKAMYTEKVANLNDWLADVEESNDILMIKLKSK